MRTCDCEWANLASQCETEQKTQFVTTILGCHHLMLFIMVFNEKYNQTLFCYSGVRYNVIHASPYSIALNMTSASGVWKHEMH